MRKIESAIESLKQAGPPVQPRAKAGANRSGNHPDGTVVVRGGRDTDVRWWTWADYRANATLATTLTTIADPLQRPTDTCIRLREDATSGEWRKAVSEAAGQLCLPAVDARALNGLKFSAALPTRLAESALPHDSRLWTVRWLRSEDRPGSQLWGNDLGRRSSRGLQTDSVNWLQEIRLVRLAAGLP